MPNAPRDPRQSPYAVVDLFAGPGGLAEGFWAARDSAGRHAFKIELSVEKDAAAFSTLLLRTFLRQHDGGFPNEYYEFLKGNSHEPDWATLYPLQWRQAQKRALRLELGIPPTRYVLTAKLLAIRKAYAGRTVLIGGPPCQAYSLIGRARNGGNERYIPENDARQTLYQDYISALNTLRPAAFVMENVRGILSASLRDHLIFEAIQTDLERAGAGYRLFPLDPSAAAPHLPLGAVIPPTDFLVRSEKFGVPQARHRVIVVGVRRDIAEALPQTQAPLLRPEPQATVQNVLRAMPRLRSGLSADDSPGNWLRALLRAATLVQQASTMLPPEERAPIRDTIERAIRLANRAAQNRLPRSATAPERVSKNCPTELAAWLLDHRLGAITNNETRTHMESDLARYLFTAVYGKIHGASPTAGDFPEKLAPQHRNWTSGDFADRFRVQLWGRPSTTITSHISKDGHYFIHPDPAQCRSLTVREAARLQTFPDNYFFKGNRTEQFVQVGNAVPPYLARKIAHALHSLLATADTRN